MKRRAGRAADAVRRTACSLTRERLNSPQMAWRRVALLLFAVGWGANHFASLLQVYRERLALDAAAPAMLFAMYALGLVPGLLLAGPVSDRYGRRAVVLPSALVAFGASALLGAAGASFSLLLGGRLLYGIGAGGVMSAGAAWLIELSDDNVSCGASPRNHRALCRLWPGSTRDGSARSVCTGADAFAVLASPGRARGGAADRAQRA